MAAVARPRRARRRRRAAGAALPLAAAVGYLAWHGAVAAAWFWFRFNFAYISEGPSTAQMLVRVAFVVVAAAPLYGLAFAAVADRRGRSALTWFVVGWFALSASRSWSAAGSSVTTSTSSPRRSRCSRCRRQRAVAAPPARIRRGAAIPAAAFFFVLGFHDRVMAAAGEPDPDYAQVVAWLDHHARSDDAICVWGNSPVLDFEADRPLAAGSCSRTTSRGCRPRRRARRTRPSTRRATRPRGVAMMAADLRPAAAFIVDGSPGDVAFYGKYPPAHFPRLARILACDYQPVAEVIGMRIYRRLPHAPASAERRARAQPPVGTGPPGGGRLRLPAVARGGRLGHEEHRRHRRHGGGAAPRRARPPSRPSPTHHARARRGGGPRGHRRPLGVDPSATTEHAVVGRAEWFGGTTEVVRKWERGREVIPVGSTSWFRPVAVVGPRPGEI